MITSIGSGGESAYSIALQSDGKLVVAGESFTATNSDFALVRYNLAPCAPASISGTITYGNPGGAPTPRFVSNVTLTGEGKPTIFTTTGAPGATAGQYSLTGFGSGAYTVTPSKTGGVNGAISSFDAGRIALHVAGPPNPQLNATQLIVADVSGNGSVTSFDAGMIAKFVAGPPYTPPGIGAAGTWRFTPVSNNYASVTNTIAGQDYTALLMGEVSGNWMNTGARPARTVNSGQETVDSGEYVGSENGKITVDLPKAVISAEKEIVVPVNVHGVADRGVISYEFDLRYNPSVIQPQTDAVVLKDTISRGLMAVVNAKESGLLRVVVYGAMPIDSDGVLLNLKFTAVGAPGSVSPLSFERIMFNEGDPVVSTMDGQIELSYAVTD